VVIRSAVDAVESTYAALVEALSDIAADRGG
jgi:hypothetical protein